MISKPYIVILCIYIMNNMNSLEDLEEYTYQILAKPSSDFIRGGAGGEETLKNNRRIFSRYRVKPKCMTNLPTTKNLETTVLGKKISIPIGISPVGVQKLAHTEGECAAANAAQKFQTIFVLSTVATCSIEEIAKTIPNGRKWLQLYVFKDREVTKNLIRRAEQAGFEAIVITVDNKIQGNRRGDLRNNFTLPSHLEYANFESKRTSFATSAGNLFDASLDWKDIELFKRFTNLPIIIKGILTKEDAIKATKLGIPAIIVSNHGGRQLDTVPSSLEALPEIVKEVGGKIEIYLDGGIRTGGDVFKALALGAQMVFVGRPVVWGLTYAGSEGVQKMLKMLKSEYEEILTLSGCSSTQDIKRSMVVHRDYCAHL